MSSERGEGGRDAALDALIVAALRGVPPAPGELPDPAGPEPELSAADREALDALGPDLARRLLKRARRRAAAGRPPKRRGKSRRGLQELTGSLHRDEGEGGLTEEARREMERKVRELEGEGGTAEAGGGGEGP